MQQQLDIARARDASKPSTTVTLILSIALLCGFAVALLGMTALLNSALAGNPDARIPGAERRQELVRFVRQECGFCHGLRLTGGLGTPLTAEALADKPAEALEATILYGRTGTAMPGWSPFLSEGDAHWIVYQLLRGFPDETANR